MFPKNPRTIHRHQEKKIVDEEKLIEERRTGDRRTELLDFYKKLPAPVKIIPRPFGY